jgi:hypothetical protein
MPVSEAANYLVIMAIWMTFVDMAERRPGDVDAASIVSEATHDVARFKEIYRSLSADLVRTTSFPTVVQPLIDAEHAFAFSRSMVDMLCYALPREEECEASEVVSQSYDDIYVRLHRSTGVHLPFKEILSEDVESKGEQRRYLLELIL